jgi:nicotinamide-nucleotide amidase
VSDVSASEIRSLARALLDLCKMRKLTIATAESCTGGLVCASLVDIPGSSAVVTTGFITYSNEAKHELLGVSSQTLENFGAVSKEAAVGMATGALKKARADLTVAVTGIAGPGGATPGKPVGLVHLAVAARDGRVLAREKRFGAIGRTAVRMRSVVEALKMLTELARGPAKVVKLKRLAPVAGRSRPRVSRTLRQSGGTRRRTLRP